MPDVILPSEDISKFLLFAIISLFRASEDLFPMTSRTALIRLLQFSSEKEGIRPLKPLQEAHTIPRYASLFRALFIFLLNSYEHQPFSKDQDLRGLYRSP